MAYDNLWNNPSTAAAGLAPFPTLNNDLAWSEFGQVTITAIGGAFTVTGIAAPLNDRTSLTLINASGQTLTIENASTSSSSGNRITTGSGGNVTVANDGTVTLQYDRTNSLWRIVSKYP